MTTTPQFLGRYELLESLGEGGMGAVWLARLSGTGGFEKLCIVKTVLPAIAKDQQFVARFSHEGRVLTQLQHSNIAQVFDMGESDGTLFIALEYVPGLDVSKLQRASSGAGQKLPIEISTFIIQQAAEGLGFAHRKTLPDGTPLKIVHRDVSPQNIMVSWDGEVKVIDFGISKSEAKSHSTAQASVMGKLGYMAPEQARGEPLDHRADQYALGVMLWELLANEPLVPRGTVTEMVVAMAHPKVRRLSPLLPEVPADLENAILKALSADPSQRFETTDDFARALLDALSRRSGIPTRRQIGDFVKQWGQTHFVEQQALLTRISTIRTPQPGSSKSGATAKMNQSADAEPAMSTAELQKSVKRSAAPVFIIGGLVVVGLLAAGAYVLGTRSGGGSAVPPVPEAKKVEVPVVTPPPVPPVEKPKMVVQAETTSEIFADGDQTVIFEGASTGLTLGQKVRIVGPELPAGGRALIGEATVTNVKPEMIRLELNSAAKAESGPRFVLLKEKGATAAANPVETTKPVEVAKPAEPVKAIEPIKPVDVVKPVEPVKPTAPAKLTAALKLQRAPKWMITVTNTSSFTWQNCSVFIPGKRKWVLKSLSPRFMVDMPLNFFQPDNTAPDLVDAVEIRCAQGSIRLPARE